MSTFGKIFVVVSTLSIVILFALLMFRPDILSDAAIALLGVLLGSLVPSAVQLVVSDSTTRQQFRLAALEKRLHAHQEAYAMWQRLLFSDNQTGEYRQLVMDCKNWWGNNCLYLSAGARVAFRNAFDAAANLSLPASMQAGADAMRKDVEILQRAGEIIVKGVYLPTIGEDEAK